MNGVKDACKRSSNPLPLLPSPQEWINKAGIVIKNKYYNNNNNNNNNNNIFFKIKLYSQI